MSEPFLGEIRLFAGNFAPRGHMFCAGQLLQISENDALFGLIGTTYGGDGVETFALPDLRGRSPVHKGQGAAPLPPYGIGFVGGQESVTLDATTMATHAHIVSASPDPGTENSPAANVSVISALGPDASPLLHVWHQAGGANALALSSASMSTAGGSQSHNNIQPTLAISYIIATAGIFPSRN